jgi:hypothetical protein
MKGEALRASTDIIGRSSNEISRLRAVLGCEDDGFPLGVARYGRVFGWELSAVVGREDPEE